MSSFNNEEYNYIVAELLSDVLYVGGRPNRGKIASIRQYAEVIVRKILNLPPSAHVTLGSKQIVEGLRRHSANNAMLLNAINNIRELGNKCTHTQELNPIEDDDVDSAFKSLLDVYAYMFISYFTKHHFGSNLEVMSAFSLLPPIIRCIVLSHLHEADIENVAVIDKLPLAILKAYDEEKAQEWLLERKDKLSRIKAVTDTAATALMNKYGPEVAQSIIDEAPDLFSLCMDRINNVSALIREKGRRYEDFEGAAELYRKGGRVTGTAPEIVEFNALMEFVFLGRKAKHNHENGWDDNITTT